MDLLVLAQHGNNQAARGALMLGPEKYDARLDELLDLFGGWTKNNVFLFRKIEKKRVAFCAFADL